MTGAALSDAGEPAPVKSAPGNVVALAWEALSNVYDPELCLDVVSLGLVYDVHEGDGTVVVEMTLTTQGCPASESIQEMAQDTIADAIGGAAGVDVRIVWEPPWSPAMMTDDAARALGFPIP
jgi:metal-sulfur cluster biosynthetic enzyme